MRFRSSNPVFNSLSRDRIYSSEGTVTYNGIAIKTLFLFLIAITSGYFVISNIEFVASNGWIFIVAIIGTFVSIFASRNPNIAKIFAPLYALFEGIILGYIIALYSAIAPEIILPAILITLSVFLGLLFLYATGIVRVGALFRRVVIGALLGLFIFTMVTMVIGFFSSSFAESFYTSQTILIISLIGAVIASLMILLDLDNCTRFVQAGAPKEYEWTLGLGLMVTIVWLFIEVLRILLIFSQRD